MATIAAQKAVSEYHAEMLSMHGHNMFRFHRRWHIDNPNPARPQRPDPNWGTDIEFGENFLQMHHEMVKATDDEQKFHMNHQSIVSWFKAKGYDLPAEWNPLTPIPSDLDYTPSADEIKKYLPSIDISTQELERETDSPEFQLPSYFTREGIRQGEQPEPITGARKLADFKNINQLGCVIVRPHDRWHMIIGGAMGNPATAIADPIFYFGVHWHIDRVFDEYKLILAERDIRPLDRRALMRSNALSTEAIQVPDEFTLEQVQELEEADALSKRLRELLLKVE
jgi:hypothetical protein